MVEIQKGKGKQPIVCALSTRSVKKGARWVDEGYEALSYVWAPKSQNSNFGRRPGVISLKNSTSPDTLVPFRVSWNLMRALSSLRRPDESRTIWIDQICVNQHKSLEPQEKDQQMPLMPQVYRNATQVISWVGALTREIKPLFNRKDHRRRLTTPEKRGLLDLVSRENWSRVWIIQELALAPDDDGIFELPSIIFQCDDQTLDNHTFIDMVESIDTASFNATDVYDIFPNIAKGSVEAAIRTSVRPIQMIRLYCQRRAQGRDENVSLLNLVQGLRNWSCGEPVDLIMGLKAISHQEDFQAAAPGYQYDYEGGGQTQPGDEELLTSLRQVGTPFMLGQPLAGNQRTTLFGLVKTFGGLVTSYANLNYRLDGLNCHTGPRHQYLPSWIPNFRERNTRHSLIQSQRTAFNWFSDPSQKYEAAVGRNPEFQWDGFGMLSIHGFSLDTVVNVAQPFSPDLDSVMSVEAANEELKHWAESGVWDQIGSWSPDMYSDGPRGFSGSVRRVATGNVAYRGSHRSLTQEEMTALDSDLSHPNPLQQVAQMFPEAVLRVQLGRRFFQTDLGFLGVGPEEMAVGDVLIVCFGSQTPFLIRRRPSGLGHWMFVGDCYVQNLMHKMTLEAWESTPSSAGTNGRGEAFLLM